MKHNHKTRRFGLFSLSLAICLMVGLLSGFVAYGKALPAPNGGVIEPGVDVWATDGAATITDFEETPIPPHFFDKGSEKFAGTVQFKGVPIGSLSGADTAVERKDPIHLPSGDTRIELTELSLASVSSIAVSMEGGGVQHWDVYAGLSPSRPSEGWMRVHQTSDLGGRFDSEFTVHTFFTFIRQSDGAKRVLDAAKIGLELTLTAHDVPWSSEPPKGVIDTGLSSGFYVSVDPDTQATKCIPHESPDGNHNHQVEVHSIYRGTCEKQ
ncbi:MAG: hypothetical protein ACPGWR_24755 [Ardenticatenaceae bacterium]